LFLLSLFLSFFLLSLYLLQQYLQTGTLLSRLGVGLFTNYYNCFDCREFLRTFR
jgi:hypothetical protein